MQDEYDFTKGKRGAIEPAPPGKTRITIRLDNEVLDWFREEVGAMGGGSYQTLINDALRDYVQLQKEPLEAILRRVVREELSKLRTERFALPKDKPKDWQESLTNHCMALT